MRYPAFPVPHGVPTQLRAAAAASGPGMGPGRGGGLNLKGSPDVNRVGSELLVRPEVMTRTNT